MAIIAFIVICWLFFIMFVADFTYDFTEFMFKSCLSCLLGFVLFLIVCMFTTIYCPSESIIVKDYNIYKINIKNTINEDEFYAWVDSNYSDTYKCLVINGNNIESKSVTSSEIMKIEDPSKTRYVVYDKQYKDATMRKLFWFYQTEWNSLEIPDKYIKINIDFK